jgi:type III secretory pathway component EscR
MTARAISATGCALLLALFLTAPRVASAATVTDANVAELTATAKTAADHEALAAYYRKEAKEASANAEFHENMLQRWNAAPGKQSFNAMKPHCQRLIDAYQEAAESYEALAKLHTQLAKEAQK